MVYSLMQSYEKYIENHPDGAIRDRYDADTRYLRGPDGDIWRSEGATGEKVCLMW